MVEAIMGILAPYVGSSIADTCVRATALSIGKTSDELTREDLPTLVSNIRRTLSPVAPVATVDAILVEIERAA